MAATIFELLFPILFAFPGILVTDIINLYRSYMRHAFAGMPKT